MKAYHNTRQTEYRRPYGAVKCGTAVSLAIDVFEAPQAECACRLWTDGKGETIVPMRPSPVDGGLRFTCSLDLREPDIVWYSFIITSGGQEYRVGAKPHRYGGEGEIYSHEPPSFQITVYNERIVPNWYKGGIAYQIFPDRFARGEDWQRRAVEALGSPRKGPKRALCPDWYALPKYEKDSQGRVTRWDFYGGTLSGIRERLGYLKELGVTVLYLNPIFEAASNHRYDTGDYLKVDPILGDEAEFKKLCAEAEKCGIAVILDGVFNHTGSDSRYFNKYGNYPETGAFQSGESEYRKWYNISADGYGSWWGVDDLPDMDESCPTYREFIYNARDSVARRWLRAGARGWRLDVADELPDDFIAGVKDACLKTKKDSVVIGEVWEDASNKISYGKLRRYLLGGGLDGVMNYPLRDGLIDFVMGKISSEELCERLETLKENYPPEAFFSSLNILGSHDRPRLMTVLGGAPEEWTLDEEERAAFRLTEENRNLAKARLWLLVLCQMTLPGVPCVYYGDEAGLEGFSDPYNRAGFPWGGEDKDAGDIYRNAISLRKTLSLFTEGDFLPFSGGGDVFGFTRRFNGEGAAVIINRNLTESHTVSIPALSSAAVELVSGHRTDVEGETACVTLPPMGSAVVYFRRKERMGKPLELGSGILCHVTSLPNERGAGTLGKPAEKFVDFLKEAGQKYWQLLPLNPTDEHGSPYAGVSAFAGNTALIDTGGRTMEELFREFLPDEDFYVFCRKNNDWLDKYAVFMALQSKFDGVKWQDWPKEYRKFSKELLQETDLSGRIAFYRFGQYKFFAQWQKVRDYASKTGIIVIGDMPMFVSADSADVWADPELFLVDGSGRGTLCAGVPPDYFCKDGQLWGNPLYDWETMKKTGFSWWLKRFMYAFELYDFVRLDHFRGFEACWAIPAGGRAAEGRWIKGPDGALFEAAEKRFGKLPILAEDLGSITPAVRALTAKCGFCGMDVLQFYDTDPREGYDPPTGKAVYTGTHDNQTLIGWCGERYPEEDPEKTAAALIVSAMHTKADAVILPLQDVLGLGDSARMNTPGTIGKNWMWQAAGEDFSGAAARLLNITRLTGRS